MAFDPHSLFAFANVITVISQASNILVITITSGRGALFQVGQQVTLSPINVFATIDNAMVGRITGVSGDTLTIDYSSGNREGSSAQAITSNYVIGQGVTPKVLTDIEAAINTNAALIAAGLALGLKSLTTTVIVSGATAPTPGQLLTAIDSTHASWQSPVSRPSFRAHNATTPSIANNTSTKMPFDTVDFDSNSNYDGVTNYRFTPTVAGKYLVTVVVEIQTAVDNTALYASIYKNGVEFSSGQKILRGVLTQNVQVTDIVTMNGTTDYIEGWTFQGSGAAAIMLSNSARSYITGVLVG